MGEEEVDVKRINSLERKIKVCLGVISQSEAQRF